MTHLAPIELEDGIIIYIEATDNVNLPDDKKENEGTKKKFITRGGGMNKAMQNLKSIEGTIRGYTAYTLNAFKKIAVANVDKVTLEFGIKVGGEAGIPYVTKGTAESNLKITVECSFPK